jgi:hypothetical protein
MYSIDFPAPNYTQFYLGVVGITSFLLLQVVFFSLKQNAMSNPFSMATKVVCFLLLLGQCIVGLLYFSAFSGVPAPYLLLPFFSFWLIFWAPLIVWQYRVVSENFLRKVAFLLLVIFLISFLWPPSTPDLSYNS